MSPTGRNCRSGLITTCHSTNTHGDLLILKTSVTEVYQSVSVSQCFFSPVGHLEKLAAWPAFCFKSQSVPCLALQQISVFILVWSSRFNVIWLVGMHLSVESHWGILVYCIIVSYKLAGPDLCDTLLGKLLTGKCREVTDDCKSNGVLPSLLQQGSFTSQGIGPSASFNLKATCIFPQTSVTYFIFIQHLFWSFKTKQKKSIKTAQQKYMGGNRPFD